MLTPEFDRANRIAIAVNLAVMAFNVLHFVVAKGPVGLVFAAALMLFTLGLLLKLAAQRDEQRRRADEKLQREALRRLRGSSFPTP